MSTFERISTIDITSLNDKTLSKLQEYSKKDIFQIKDLSKDPKYETIPRDTDALLISLLTPLQKDQIKAFPMLRYIGVYGSSMRRIDLDYCNELGVHVTNVPEYCDKETAEAIIAHVMMYFRHLGPWKAREGLPHSLYGKTLGIVGLGKVGTELARYATSLGMSVSYFSRNQKPELEKELNLRFLSLNQLLESNKVVSIHTPPNELILGPEEFKSLSPNNLLINTCPGDIMNWEELREWLANGGEALFDHFARQNLEELPKGIEFMDHQAYRTEESIDRLQLRILKNIEFYLETK